MTTPNPCTSKASVKLKGDTVNHGVFTDAPPTPANTAAPADPNAINKSHEKDCQSRLVADRSMAASKGTAAISTAGANAMARHPKPLICIA
jgi:hypothetical protein